MSTKKFSVLKDYSDVRWQFCPHGWCYIISSQMNNAPLEDNLILVPFSNSFPLSRAEHQSGASLLLGQNRWDRSKFLAWYKLDSSTSTSYTYFCLYTVLLGVLDQKVGERTFQAIMERRMAMLLGEAMGLVRRVKRATTIGNSSVQVFKSFHIVFQYLLITFTVQKLSRPARSSTALRVVLFI